MHSNGCIISGKQYETFRDATRPFRELHKIAVEMDGVYEKQM